MMEGVWPAVSFEIRLGWHPMRANALAVRHCSLMCCKMAIRVFYGRVVAVRKQMSLTPWM